MALAIIQFHHQFAKDSSANGEQRRKLYIFESQRKGQNKTWYWEPCLKYEEILKCYEWIFISFLLNIVTSIIY
jgi:hypothetical protein